MNNIVIENFYYAYKGNRLVLKDVNLQIEKGSFTVITGPSGAGKTTLCKALTGVVPFYMGGSYSGQVLIDGESTKGKKVSDLAMKIGYIMEDYESQLVSLTAGEEIAFGLINHGFAPEEIKERTTQALNDVGLPGREDYQLEELSGGQRQRLLLASILAVRPEIIVLDEPVSAMDPEGAQSLYKLISEIHKHYGTTIIVVEHRMDYVLPYVTNLIAIKQGEILAAASYEEAAVKMYEDEAMRKLLPNLWQVKLGLEQKLGLKLGNWRKNEDALEDFRKYGLEGRKS